MGSANESDICAVGTPSFLLSMREILEFPNNPKIGIALRWIVLYDYIRLFNEREGTQWTIFSNTSTTISLPI